MADSRRRNAGFPASAAQALESRTLLTAYTVDTLVDESDGNISPGDLSLREAIELSNDNPPLDEIVFSAALAGGTIQLGGTELLVTQAVTIDAQSLQSLTVNGMGVSRVFRLTGGGEVVIRGLTITGGDAGSGDGGGIFAQSAALTLEFSTVSDSTARLGGGVATAGSGNHVIRNSAILGNHATIHGGGVLQNGADGSLFIENSTVAGNSANNSGGGLGHYFGGFGVAFTTIVNNVADADGDGVGFGGGLSTNEKRFLSASIVAGNVNQDVGSTHADDIGGQGVHTSVLLTQYNVIGDPASAGGASPNANYIGADGSGNGLLPLEDVIDPNVGLHGGRTLNFLPQLDGPAIDIAPFTSTELEFDQRGPGFPRRRGEGTSPRVDAGSIERELIRPATEADIVAQTSSGRLLVASSDGTQFTTTVAGALDPAVDWDNLQAVDMNNDGLTDLVGFSNTQGRVIRLLMGENGLFGAPQLGSPDFDPTQTWVDMVIGEFDGDGRLDVALRSQETGQWIVDPFSGLAFSPVTWSPNVTWPQVLVGDFNGDGFDDIAGRASSGTWIVSRSSGTPGNFITSVWGGWSTIVDWDGVTVGDLNGDELDDIVGRASSGTIVGGLSTGSGFDMSVFGGLSPGGQFTDLMLGDFDDDGNSDLFARSSSGRVVVGLSNGSQFNFSQFAAISSTAGFADFQIADFDADGRSDFAARSASGKWIVGISDGGAFSISQWAVWSTAVGYNNVLNGEFALI